MWKFKSLKGKDKWLFLLTIGIILCILAFPAGRIGNADQEKNMEMENNESGGKLENTEGIFENETDINDIKGKSGDLSQNQEYVREMETRVRELLSHVDGVGEVDVMIVLKSSSETVWHTDVDRSYSLTEETDSGGGTRRAENESQEKSTVLYSSGGESGPLAEKEIYPEISGIVISAEGGGSPQVQAEISQAMEALFGLAAHKIKILKRVK